jgi:hypothetical protein
MGAGLSQAHLSRTPPPKHGHPLLDPGIEEAWFMVASPCHQVQSPGLRGLMSTRPGGAHLGVDASSRMPSGYMPSMPAGMVSPVAAHVQQLYDYGVPMSPVNGATWATAGHPPASPCMTRAGPSGIVSTSPQGQLPVGTTAQSGEASSRRPSLQLLEVGSPCHTHAGGIISTSPFNTGTPVNAVMSQSPSWPGPQCAVAEAHAVDPAGSPAADALRSWLAASGLPPCGDLAWQLQAVAPETYED